MSRGNCLDCGKTITNAPRSPRCVRCAGLKRRQPLINSDGYMSRFMPEHPLAFKNGYILEHRLVLSDAGIDLPEGTVVHHKNGDKLDNRIENLEVIDRRAHGLLHGALVRAKPLPCVNCKRMWVTLRRGRCKSCADYFYNNGIERPVGIATGALRWETRRAREKARAGALRVWSKAPKLPGGCNLPPLRTH